MEQAKQEYDFPMVWDNTMRGNFSTCPKKFFWEFIRCLGPAKTSIHLHFGACFAAGLEELRNQFYGNGLDIEAAKAKGAAVIIAEWGEYEEESGHVKNLNTCLGAFDAYIEQYPPATDNIQPHMVNGKPSVEFSFAIPIEEVIHPVTGDPLIYAGRFDMLGVYNDQLFVVDEKTTTSLGNSWLNQWDLRAQFTGYCWAAQQFNLPVAGAIVRGTSILKTKFGHAEVITYRPDWHINMWREQLVRDLKRAVRCYEEGYWDLSLDSGCTNYGGCTFKRLCDTPNPDLWVDSYFVERHWNPLQADPLEKKP